MTLSLLMMLWLGSLTIACKLKTGQIVAKLYIVRYSHYQQSC